MEREEVVSFTFSIRARAADFDALKERLLNTIRVIEADSQNEELYGKNAGIRVISTNADY